MPQFYSILEIYNTVIIMNTVSASRPHPHWLKSSLHFQLYVHYYTFNFDFIMTKICERRAYAYSSRLYEATKEFEEMLV